MKKGGEFFMTGFDAKMFSKLLTELYHGGRYVLKDVAKKYEYKDEKRTDKVAGYDYTVVETSTYDTLTVRVANLTPLIEPEELEKSGKHPLVKFSEDAVAKPVKLEYGRIRVTITASSISFDKQA